MGLRLIPRRKKYSCARRLSLRLTEQRMVTKRRHSETDLAETREFQIKLLRAANEIQGALAMLEQTLPHSDCIHNFRKCPVSGPRDNGEYEYVCTNCGLTE